MCFLPCEWELLLASRSPRRCGCFPGAARARRRTLAPGSERCTYGAVPADDEEKGAAMLPDQEGLCWLRRLPHSAASPMTHKRSQRSPNGKGTEATWISRNSLCLLLSK